MFCGGKVKCKPSLRRDPSRQQKDVPKRYANLLDREIMGI